MESVAEMKAREVASGMYRNMTQACDSMYGYSKDPVVGMADTAPAAMPKTESPHSFSVTSGTDYMSSHNRGMSC